MKKKSICPNWLDLSPDRTTFIFVPERAKIVQMMFDLSIGGLGSYGIAKHLSKLNVPPFGMSTKWDHTTIDSMLRNRAMIGEFQPKSYSGGDKKGVANGAPISGYYPAIIDEATFKAAQEARRRNLTVGRGRKGENITNIFAGVRLVCAYCGSPMKFRSKVDSKSFMCAQVLQRVGCIRAAWSYRNFESSVLHFLVHPALIEGLRAEHREAMANFVKSYRTLGTDIYQSRFQLALFLKQAISDLKLACAGLNPSPTLAEAQIRRDNPDRFFEVKLWESVNYVGLPVEP